MRGGGGELGLNHAQWHTYVENFIKRQTLRPHLQLPPSRFKIKEIGGLVNLSQQR